MMKHALLATCAVVVSFGAHAATAGTITYDDYTGVCLLYTSPSPRDP